MNIKELANDIRVNGKVAFDKVANELTLSQLKELAAELGINTRKEAGINSALAEKLLKEEPEVANNIAQEAAAKQTPFISLGTVGKIALVGGLIAGAYYGLKWLAETATDEVV